VIILLCLPEEDDPLISPALLPLQDNLNVFLKACRKLGLKEAQLFHPGDLQDLSTRVTVK